MANTNATMKETARAMQNDSRGTQPDQYKAWLHSIIEAINDDALLKRVYKFIDTLRAH